jgi:hypothetical protein
MGEIYFDANAIFNGVVGSVALLIAAWALGWTRARLGLLSDRMTLRLYQSEVKQVERLMADPMQLAIFLLTYLLICFALLGLGVGYAPIAFLDDGTKWIGPVLACLGLAVYACSVYTLGIIYRVKKGERYLGKQREKIEALEKRLSLKSVRQREET